MSPTCRILILLGIGLLPSALEAGPQAQEKLDPAKDLLTSVYVKAEMTLPFAYVEIDYPEGFKKDGEGSLNTKPKCPQLAPDFPEPSDWMIPWLETLGRNPKDQKALGTMVLGLSNMQQFTRLVPFMDRYLAAGGKPDFNQLRIYVPGLARLGRYDEAISKFTLAQVEWGSMTNEISAYLFHDRFIYCWAVSRNFKDMLDALDYGKRCGLASHHEHAMERTILELLRTAAKQGELPWFLKRMDKFWIWLSDENVAAAVGIVTSAGLPVPPALKIAADPLFEGTAVPSDALRLRAITTIDRGDAATALRQAQRGAELGKAEGPGLYLEALIVLARVLRQREDLEKAWDVTQEAEALAKELNTEPEIGWTHIMKGFLFHRVADYRKAADCFQKALKVGNSLKYYSLIQSAKKHLGLSLALSGFAEQVEPELKKTALEATKFKLTTSIPSAYRDWGICLSRLERYGEALGAFMVATGPLPDADPDFKQDAATIMSCHLEKGRALLAMRDFSAAIKAFDDYAALAKTTESETAGWAWQLGMAKAKRGLGEKDESFRLIQQCLATIESQRASLLDFNKRRTLNDNKYEAYELASQILMERGEVEQAFRVAEQSRARCFLDEMGAHSADAKKLELVDIASVEKACDGFSSVVYYQLPDQLLVWVFSGGKSQRLTLPLMPYQTEHLVRNLLIGICREQGSAVRDQFAEGLATPSGLQAAQKAYQALWAPVKELLGESKRVCIIPHRALHYVPFQALHDGKSHLIETLDLFYAPSATALLELRRRKGTSSTTVAVFDSILTKDLSSTFRKTETLDLEKQFPEGDFHKFGKATMAAFKERAPKAGVVHVSSHGYFNPWIPLDSGLVLSSERKMGDGVVRARDIYGLKFENTALIVMSACVSSVGDFSAGDEVTGLTRAFQVAGIPNVIGSLWPVPNEATTELMTVFYQRLMESKDPVSALRAAQREMIAKQTPLFGWAAFQVTGNGRKLNRE